MKKTVLLVTAMLLLVACSTTPPAAEKKEAPIGSIVRLDPAFDALVPQTAAIEKLAGGFTFTESPLWRPSGVVWFSDVIGNVVRQWSPDGTVTEILKPGGYDGNSLPAGGYIGPNGMVNYKDGSVLLCQHGNRRIALVGADMKVSTFIDKYEGRKLNSPNDLIFRSDGSLYFTDPPYGLPKADDDPTKEQKVNGVYRWANGKVQLLVKDMTRPNGIAFSPDEKTLYVANSDDKKRIWMRYDVAPNGTVSNGKVFADVTADPAAGLPDGMKADSQGNLWVTGGGGVRVYTPDGKHLGTIKTPENPASVGWGDDGKSLYITAETGLYRIKTAATGLKALY
jgi:gluconolactonase